MDINACTHHTGFETYIAAAWKRLVAEVIDIFLFALLLKAYVPEADLRCVFGGRVQGRIFLQNIGDHAYSYNMYLRH